MNSFKFGCCSVNSRCSGIGRSCLLLSPLFIDLQIISLRGGTIKLHLAGWLCKKIILCLLTSLTNIVPCASCFPPRYTGELYMCSDTDEVELSVMRLMAYTRNVPLYHKWPHHRKLIGEFYPSTLDSTSWGFNCETPDSVLTKVEALAYHQDIITGQLAEAGDQVGAEVGCRIVVLCTI
jgi:hypothetical protein